MNKLYLLIVFVIPNYIYSQESITQEADSTEKINYREYMDKEIEQLLQKNKDIHYKKGGIEGFCVQIYSGDSRGESQRIKSQFMKRFPEIKSVFYERVSPNWKVRAGKLRTRLEVKKLQNIIKEMYPSAYITEKIVPFGRFD
ncbi:MAG: SPOR domain-containing protein [Flavobacteriales bacterium]|nr:SPOR domain-containing protein [Flavobacteriales bacterium]|tara:strand:- start:288 stop:713 length:426 start_codon:yes stop_codon:yes gene_type:complete